MARVFRSGECDGELREHSSESSELRMSEETNKVRKSRVQPSPASSPRGNTSVQTGGNRGSSACWSVEKTLTVSGKQDPAVCMYGTSPKHHVEVQVKLMCRTQGPCDWSRKGMCKANKMYNDKTQL
ncbi:hypothetical protein CIHG_04060 [Coccidioides immitis H538.4]|uniref:Uncharacterized protein n=1 Tax=Coccidioides immitis H538.4 TaxID=396776 RepID=A0A0J8RNA7_COCIT|nr:hypothetical protein CIHG_04060 [Coccidioides immitis H538.4]